QLWRQERTRRLARPPHPWNARAVRRAVLLTSTAVLASLAARPAHASPPIIEIIEAPESTPLIYGGQATETCEWPSTVSMAGNCTGTLVHPEIVFYAGHCGH